VAELTRDGTVKPCVDRTFPLAEARAAMELQALGAARGKLVITM
jgi:NADPH:quinone reductase-like Zn-dependent oxidoreductase